MECEHTLGSCPWCPCHACSLQAFVVTEELSTGIASTCHERLCVLARLANLDDILELVLANLGRRQVELPPAADGLCLLELLDLRVACGDELGLVVLGTVALFSFSGLALALFALGFLLLGFALVIETTQGLPDRCGGDAGLLL